jgi:hypothetical protein
VTGKGHVALPHTMPGWTTEGAVSCSAAKQAPKPDATGLTDLYTELQTAEHAQLPAKYRATLSCEAEGFFDCSFRSKCRPRLAHVETCSSSPRRKHRRMDIIQLSSAVKNKLSQLMLLL